MNTTKNKLIKELRELTKSAIKFKRLAEQAKTEIKFEFYSKKLKENNERAFDVIKALQPLQHLEQDSSPKEDIISVKEPHVSSNT